MRVSISRAARRVNVNSNIRSGATPWSINQAARAVKRRGLPRPGASKRQQRTPYMRHRQSLLLVQPIQFRWGTHVRSREHMFVSIARALPPEDRDHRQPVAIPGTWRSDAGPN